MNLFLLSWNMDEAAQAHVDRHVVKMVLECAQLVSTAVRTLEPERDDIDTFYRATHRNHPWARWARASGANFRFVCEFGAALGREYAHRYEGRRHKSLVVIERALAAPPARYEPFAAATTIDVENGGITLPVPQCMPDECRRECPVDAYRAYYASDAKRALHAWRRRERPAWLHSANDVEGVAPKRRRYDR